MVLIKSNRIDFYRIPLFKSFQRFYYRAFYFLVQECLPIRNRYLYVIGALRYIVIPSPYLLLNIYHPVAILSAYGLSLKKSFTYIGTAAETAGCISYKHH